MISILRLDHLVLRSARPERLTRFYCEALGCAVERHSDRVGLTQLRAGESLIDIVDLHGPLGSRNNDGDPSTGKAPNLDHFCLRVEPFDPEAIRVHLAGLGIEGGPVETHYGADGFGPAIYFEDPDGNTVELKGPPERPPEPLEDEHQHQG